MKEQNSSHSRSRHQPLEGKTTETVPLEQDGSPTSAAGGSPASSSDPPLTEHADLFGTRVFPKIAFPPTCTLEQVAAVVWWGKDYYNGRFSWDEGTEGWLVFTVRCKPEYVERLRIAAENVGARIIGEEVPRD